MYAVGMQALENLNNTEFLLLFCSYQRRKTWEFVVLKQLLSYLNKLSATIEFCLDK